MINRASTCSFCRMAAMTALAATVAAAGLAGCAGEEPAPVAVAPPPPPPPPPPAPTVTPIADLMVQYRIDGRVVLPEDKAPNNDPDRIAVLQFFDAFARGEERTAGEMMSAASREELDAIVKSGEWAETVAAIEQIEVQTGDSEFGPCALAIFQTGLELQPQLWYYNRSELDGHTFDPAAQPPDILDRLSGPDLIKAWHQVLADELALADRPDEEFTVDQQNLTSSGSSSAGSAPSNPSSPGFSPASSPPGFGRRTPPSRKRKAPGPGG